MTCFKRFTFSGGTSLELRVTNRMGKWETTERQSGTLFVFDLFMGFVYNNKNIE